MELISGTGILNPGVQLISYKLFNFTSANIGFQPSIFFYAIAV